MGIFPFRFFITVSLGWYNSFKINSLILCCFQKLIMKQNPLPSTGTETVPPTKKLSARYLSLDVFRGLTIALMVIVNNPGSWRSIYAPFEHASWHGFTPTDLVFPAFLFAVGNAMSFSMRKFEQQPDSIFLKKVFKRTLLIFACGLLLT